MILATVATQFQADAALQTRASSYRLEKVKCRYAAESGMVVASVLVQEAIINEQNKLYQQDKQSNSPKKRVNEEDEDSGNDSPFLVKQKTINIDGVEVKIEIYDENAKIPLLWFFKAPFGSMSASRGIETGMKKLGKLLDADTSAVNEAMKLIRTCGSDLVLPNSEIRLSKRGVRSSRRSSGQPKASRSSWRVSQRFPSIAERNADEKMRREAMGVFSARWYNTLFTDPQEHPINESLAKHPGKFRDYLGSWGHNFVNINTAPTEVLESYFLPLGVSPKAIKQIDAYRKKTPFVHEGDLNKISEIGIESRRAVIVLSRVVSDTFTARVEARVGRARYSLLGGLYRNRKNRVVTQAVFPGE